MRHKDERPASLRSITARLLVLVTVPASPVIGVRTADAHMPFDTASASVRIASDRATQDGNLYTATPDPHVFYRRPQHLGQRDLGEVVRSRAIELHASAGFPEGTEAWQLLYRSTNFRGKPMHAITTVLRPAGRPAGLVSYQVPEDASFWACAPSHSLRAADGGDGAPSTDTQSISQLLERGFAVSVPDYEGPQSMFGARRQPGYAILDGLRAAIAFPKLGVRRQAPLGMWGHSGGSMASGWAAEIQERYAPELRVRGTALGGFLTRILSGFKAVNGGPAAGFIPGLSPSLFRSNSRLGRAFDAHLNSDGRAALGRGATQCLNDNLTEFAMLDMSRLLDIPWAEFVKLKNVRNFRPHNLGRGAPESPLYVYHAVNDELVYIKHTDAAVNRYCARDTPVEYHRVLVGEHLSLQATGIPAAVAWLEERLTGTETARGCSTVTEPAP